MQIIRNHLRDELLCFINEIVYSLREMEKGLL